MNIEKKMDKICINQLIAQKKEDIEAENDVIIPDIKPDVLKSISTNGNVCIYKKEVLEGKIRIDGSINANIMYLADDNEGSIRAVSSNIDFTKVIEMENVRPNMMLECTNLLNNIECKIINGRKISLKGSITFNIKVFSNEEVNLIESIDNIQDIQMLNTNVNLNSLIGHGTTKTIAKETINIDEIDNLAEIMKVNVDIINIQNKISYNKVLAKADFQIKIVYLTDDNRVNSAECKIPVMGFIDIQSINEENVCDINSELKNLIIKPSNIEEHSIYIEAEIEFMCVVFEKRQLQIIQDMYSPSIELKNNCKKIDILQDKSLIESTCNIREKQIVSEIGNGKICDMDVKPIIKRQNILNGKVIFDGDIDINIMYSKGNSIETKAMTIPFTHSMECEEIKSKCDLEAKFEIDNKDVIIMPDQNLDIKIDLRIILNVIKKSQINIISDIEATENRDLDSYSIVIYFVKPGDTLWEIAKKLGSTVDAIVNVNNIEDENKIYVGEQLFIPRFVKDRKETISSLV